MSDSGDLGDTETESESESYATSWLTCLAVKHVPQLQHQSRSSDIVTRSSDDGRSAGDGKNIGFVVDEPSLLSQAAAGALPRCDSFCDDMAEEDDQNWVATGAVEADFPPTYPSPRVDGLPDGGWGGGRESTGTAAAAAAAADVMVALRYGEQNAGTPELLHADITARREELTARLNVLIADNLAVQTWQAEDAAMLEVLRQRRFDHIAYRLELGWRISCAQTELTELEAEAAASSSSGEEGDGGGGGMGFILHGVPDSQERAALVLGMDVVAPVPLAVGTPGEESMVEFV